MKNAIQKKHLGKIAILAVAGAISLGQFTTMKASASAHAENDEVIYCADALYGDDVFAGQGTTSTGTYDIICDEMIYEDYAIHPSAPSFGNSNSSITNVCGPVAGTNVVVFYDRLYTELVPDYTPSTIDPTGLFFYYPDMARTQTQNVINSLYDLMDVATLGGTTATGFRNGLVEYIEGQGYSASYSSFYQSATSVNTATLATAINQDKVGVILCSSYNYVYRIQDVDGEDLVSVTKTNSTAAHIMMVFGYQTLGFYNDGEYLFSKTFLCVSSGYSTCEQGYMELDDTVQINEAWIVTVT